MRNEQSIEYTKANYQYPLCLCIGGEKRGLGKEIIDLSDQFVEIKYPTQYRVALTAVSSSSILCFEVSRFNKEN